AEAIAAYEERSARGDTGDGLKSPSEKVGRNAPCPCGSGRKFNSAAGKRGPRGPDQKVLARSVRQAASEQDVDLGSWWSHGGESARVVEGELGVRPNVHSPRELREDGNRRAAWHLLFHRITPLHEAIPQLLIGRVVVGACRQRVPEHCV